MSDSIKTGYREKTKSRCRENVFKSIYRSGKTDDEAFTELNFFEQQYSGLKIKDYIIKMRDTAISYVTDSYLKPTERIIYVEGMGFAFECIGKIRKENTGIALTNEVQLEFINEEFSRRIEDESISLNDEEQEIFKLGILASCAIYFNVIDTKNIMEKNFVKK